MNGWVLKKTEKSIYKNTHAVNKKSEKDLIFSKYYVIMILVQKMSYQINM